MERTVFAALLWASLCWLPDMALAQAAAPTTPVGTTGVTPAATPTESETCTTFKSRQEIFNGAQAVNPDGTAKDGILSEIYRYITEVVGSSTQKLFRAFIGNDAYRAAVGGAMTLMVIIFGVGFMIGIIQPSFGQALMRLIKFGIIAAVIAPSGGWEFFSGYESDGQTINPNGAGVVRFFNDGTDELVIGVMKIATGVETIPPGATPFFQLDRIGGFILHPETIQMILGLSFGQGPFGLGMAGLLIIACVQLVKLLVQALRVYAMSFVARSLLLGVAPIFIVLLLFDRTKNTFMSWLNALISLSLQPIFFFTLLSFFIVLIESSMKDLFNQEFCWTQVATLDGTANQTSYWRVTDDNGNPIKSEMTWQGPVECLISGKDCKEFPINIVDMLTFLLLVYLVSKFSYIVERLANELANTFIGLDASGRIAHVMSERGAMDSMRAGGVDKNTVATRDRSPPNDQQTTRR